MTTPSSADLPQHDTDTDTDTDTEITLSEEAGIRYLHFGSEWVQGAMRISRPDELVLHYAQQMMGWLLFLPAPQRILQLGLGAGSLTRFCLKHCPATEVTVVDMSQAVINVARSMFALPPDGARLKVERSDAKAFIEQPTQRGRYGVVQVDLYDAQAWGPTIESKAFYRACSDTICAPGMFAVNLFGEQKSWERNIPRVTRAFEGRVIELPALRAGNRIVLGFKGPPLEVEWLVLEQRAADLRRALGLPAHEWVMALRNRYRGKVFAI